MAEIVYLILRSDRRSRLEGRKMDLQLTEMVLGA
jgi:hypothetical protein